MSSFSLLAATTRTMPSPLVIRDPADYQHDHKIDPASVLGRDVLTPVFRAVSSTDDDEHPSPSHATTHMGDISTSPRLLGYVFSFISSAVSMISSAIFYRRGVTRTLASTVDSYATSIGLDLDEVDLQLLEDRIEEKTRTMYLYFGSGGIIVEAWKIYGAIAVSGMMTTITLLVLIAHFDSICCTKKNRQFFRDGSVGERNLLLVLIVISAIALHISTSKFSVGEAQSNVFFSTWSTFLACVMNYEVWRKGSGRQHSFQKVLFDRAFPLKRHWFLLSIFSTITFFATIDYFINK